MRKRPISSVLPAITLEDPAPKKRKLYPSSFWDNLTVIPLTRSALRELDKRNTIITENSVANPQPRKANRSKNGTEKISPLSPTTCSNVRRFARQGGPNLEDLRGMSSSQSLGRRKRGSQSPQKKGSQSPTKSSTRTATTSTRSTGPYDRAFQQHLIDHNIFPDEYEYPDGTAPPAPVNGDEIRDALSQDREELSPSKFTQEDFRKFKKANAQASKESAVTTSVMPFIEGDIGDRKCTAGEIPFSNLEHLTDGTLVSGNPDRYYGARPEQLKLEIRVALEGQIMPSTQHDLPIAPNFFLQVKGPDGTPGVAIRQACYDAALGARGIHSLRAYADQEELFDNKAYVLTTTYQAGLLTIYAIQPIRPEKPGGSPGYVMTQLKAFALTSDEESFRKGASAYRNGRDWAKKERDEVIQQANEAWSKRLLTISALRHSVSSLDSDASTGETMATSQGTVVPVPEFTGESDGSADERAARVGRPVKRKSRSPQKQSTSEQLF